MKPFVTIMILLIAGVLAGDDGTARGEPASVSPSPRTGVDADIQQWVVDLDADQFVVRESAMRRLIEAGTAAVEPVSSAVGGQGREPATRGVYVLRSLATSGDGETEQAATAALRRLAADTTTSAARRARASLDALQAIRQERALVALRRLGATIQTYSDAFGSASTYSIRIENQWTGSNSDLVQLQRLVDVHRIVLHGSQVDDAFLAALKPMPNLTTVNIDHAKITSAGMAHLTDVANLRQLNVWYSPIDDEAVEHLARLKDVQYVSLLGTNISVEGRKRLQEALTGVELKLNNGAFLGVGGSANYRQCVITSVHTGSAADQAGLRVGDTIQHFNGSPVDDFDSLRVLIGENRGGDEVDVKIQRGSNALVKRVRLGEWPRQHLY